MNDEPRERWLELCELAAREHDPAKMLALVSEINRLLEEKETLLQQKCERAGVVVNARLLATSQATADLYLPLPTA